MSHERNYRYRQPVFRVRGPESLVRQDYPPSESGRPTPELSLVICCIFPQPLTPRVLEKVWFSVLGKGLDYEGLTSSLDL